MLAPQVDFRGLTPNRAWEADDAETLVDIILASWLEPKDEVDELVDVSTDRVSDRQSVTYRLRGHNPDGPFVVEQNAFLASATAGSNGCACSARASARPADDYLTNRISEYFGSGHRSSATTFSSRSATSRTLAIAVSWLSRA